MTDLDLDDTQEREARKSRPFNPFLGIFALCLGMAWLWVRAVTILAPLIVAMVIPILVAQFFWGNTGFWAAGFLAGLAVNAVWIVFGIKFCWPAFSDLTGMAGTFLQGVGRLRPDDTIGAVNRRWKDLHADGRSLWRCWRARP
ncbi:MAG: hypothetical protein LCH69_01705 [Proteobacteria bacterium]|nr:hypothetical protein [Pseudomonadota bacterium]